MHRRWLRLLGLWLSLMPPLPNDGAPRVSLWVHKIAMLLWALWLANALIGWLRGVFGAWTKGGCWLKREPWFVSSPSLPAAADAEPLHG